MFAGALPTDADLLLAAAWLHDVGYAPELAATGFHPLDGARHLEEIGAPARLVGLVAHHSAAAAEAGVLGLDVELQEFENEKTLVRDLLWLSDMTTGPTGQPMTFVERMAELRERYPADHYVVRSLEAGMPMRQQAVDRAQGWINRVGALAQV
ncbi:hypothetical protein PSU4_60790 [Pseudonocardia sulfidoxydans NBRC 16205]|uniref:Metal-dependent phosphohydrolase, HD subdomain protein n=1 Tax=Pseudonocardia sulfidoxydans NBRC 16205 TaxID=1223511 RepID=A0A511DQM6_9PSEU|nr:hypothetical protein PSU4_60790 [Pseudonocardia sulfidoxydans NBRC 16205]